MNTYKIMKDRHQQEHNDFPMFFAFSNSQFDEGMKKLGLEPTDTEKVCSIGYGGIIRKTDSEKLNSMGKRHSEEMKKAIETDDQFIYDMFDYELGNHEYTYTWDTTDTIYSLGLTPEEVESNERLLTALKNACKSHREWDAKNN